MTSDQLSGEDPPTQGWYAILYAYEPEEGYMPAAGFWDGCRWLDSELRPIFNANVFYWPQLFPTADAAARHAVHNDPNW
jgi:hypothetical protein